MISYNPKTAEKTWPEADYDATLIDVTETTSQKSGQPMEVWQIGCYHPDGREQTIKEYVTAAAAFKIKQLATALGRKSEFEAGTFAAEHHIGASFTVALMIESQDGYDDKNKVGKFKANPVKPPTAGGPVSPLKQKIAERQKPAALPVSGEPFADDDIPFTRPSTAGSR